MIDKAFFLKEVTFIINFLEGCAANNGIYISFLFSLIMLSKNYGTIS